MLHVKGIICQLKFKNQWIGFKNTTTDLLRETHLNVNRNCNVSSWENKYQKVLEKIPQLDFKEKYFYDLKNTRSSGRYKNY